MSEFKILQKYNNPDYAVIVVPALPLRLNLALSILEITALRDESAVTKRIEASTLGKVVFAGK